MSSEETPPDSYPWYLEPLWRLACVLWWLASHLRPLLIRPSKVKWGSVEGQVQAMSLNGGNLESSGSLAAGINSVRVQPVYQRHVFAELTLDDGTRCHYFEPRSANNAYLIKSDDSGLQALNGQQARLAGYWSQDIFGDDVFNAMAIRHADGVRYACEEPKWAGRSIAQAIR